MNITSSVKSVVNESSQKNKKGKKELKLIIQFLESRMKLEKQRANKMIQFCNIWDQRIKGAQDSGAVNETTNISDSALLPLIGLKPDKKNNIGVAKDSPLMEVLKSVQEESRNVAFSHYKRHLAISEALTDLKSIHGEAGKDRFGNAADIIYKYMSHESDDTL